MDKKIFLLLGFTFSFIVIIFFYLLIIERDPSDLPSQLLEKKVPIFNSKLLFSNEIFNSKNEFKNSITVVNFFASWWFNRVIYSLQNTNDCNARTCSSFS